MGRDKKKKKAREKEEEKKGRRLRDEPDRLNPAVLIAMARASAFTDEAPGRAFAHFRPLAAQVRTADLPVFTGQALLLRATVRATLAAVEPYLPEAVRALRAPKLKEVFELPSLAMGLDFAAARVPVVTLSTGEIEAMLIEGRPWRELMLTYLEVVSHPLLGIVPRERVAAVRDGSGELDKGRDFVALPGLFTEFQEALVAKHPFSADKLDLLATLGGALVREVRPGAAAVEVRKRSAESILRDQLASLVADRYDHLQVLASVALGKRRADDLLPALRSAVAPVDTTAKAQVDTTAKAQTEAGTEAEVVP
jgi:hypothetical protein